MVWLKEKNREKPLFLVLTKNFEIFQIEHDLQIQYIEHT